MSRAQLFRIADQVLNRPLLILPEKLAVISAVLGGRIGLDVAELDLEAAAARMPEASRFVGSATDEDPVTGRGRGLPYKRTADGTAVITITGSLVNRGAWVGASSGLTSYEGIKFQLEQAAADPKASGIVLDIESGGGQAIGAFEVADAVRAAAARKPVTAVVNGMAASAAYAIASGATRIVTTPSGMSGSIGVVMMHADYSRKLESEGITPTLIHAGAHKVDANPFEPLSDAVRADLQGEIDQLMDLFVATVAAGRPGLDADAIRATEARTFIGQAAVDAGLADAVGSFDDALSDLSKPRGRSAAPRRSTMSTSTADTTFAQADLDRARADGHAAGKAEGHAAGLEAGKAEGHQAGTEAERARVLGIVDHAEAQGREAQALALVKTGATVEMAAAVLATSAKGPSAGVTLAERGRAATALLPVPGADGPGAQGDKPKPAAAVSASSVYASRRQTIQA